MCSVYLLAPGFSSPCGHPDYICVQPVCCYQLAGQSVVGYTLPANCLTAIFMWLNSYRKAVATSGSSAIVPHGILTSLFENFSSMGCGSALPA